MYCRHCGRRVDVESGAMFCPHCGKPLDSVTAHSTDQASIQQTGGQREEIHCAKCGNVLNYLEINAQYNKGRSKGTLICENCYGEERMRHETEGRRREGEEGASLLDISSIKNGTSAGGRVWIGYFKAILYIAFILTVIVFFLVGWLLLGGWGGILGLVLGTIIGFASVAFGMVLIYTAENIANTTDNTYEILQIISHNQEQD